MKKQMMIIGIVCGILSALCVFAYTSMVYEKADSERQEAVNRYGGEQVNVLVATRDSYPGETLNNSNATIKTWVSNLLPEGAITDEKDAWGREVASMILSGEVISESRFKSSSADIQIPEGLVAVSVPAKDVQAVGGAIKAGSLVDVYATGVNTTCLGKNILVLATNATSQESSSKSNITWVTLAVEPSRAQEYVVASQSMDIYFTLPALSESQSSQVNAQGSNSESTSNSSANRANDQASQSQDGSSNRVNEPGSAEGLGNANTAGQTGGNAAVTQTKNDSTKSNYLIRNNVNNGGIS